MTSETTPVSPPYNPYTDEHNTYELSKDGNEMKTFLGKLQKIEQKNRCARVRFLDWLSTKLAAWSKKVKTMSDRIDSPCSIKLKE